MIPFITFICALLGLAGMIFLRIRKIRKGVVEIPEEHKIDHPAHAYIREIRDIVLDYAKRGLHILVIATLKAWVYASHVIKRYWISFSEFVAKKFEHKQGEVKVESGFLKAVGEYKKRARHFKRKLEAEEESKE